MNTKPCIGITIGDFNGVGPELLLKTLSNKLIFNYCTPVVYGTSYILTHYSNLLEMPALDFNIVKSKKDIKEGKINLRVCSTDQINITPGSPSLEAGLLAVAALALAVDDIKNGMLENLLTAPIDKATAAEAGLGFNGHTQYFAQQFESDVQMVLLNETLRVAMVTGHTALNQVSNELSTEKIAETVRTLYQNLQSDFGISKPKIAVLGVNPHGGDNGLMGNEEIEMISPAIKQLQDEGLLVIGPYPPDGFFGSANANNFDGIVGMYHDQVLIPFKQVAFSEGVNYTAGLPIIRTSPDHGTAYDIAGKGLVDSTSFINALYLINKVHRNRKEYYDTGTSKLPFKEHRREKFSIGVPDLR